MKGHFMADKVYIVTSGYYSEYGINAVFLNKEKAKMYCATRNGGRSEYYTIEEWNLSDKNTYTPKKSMEVNMFVKNSKKRITFNYYTSALEDDKYHYQNNGYISVWGFDNYEIRLKRKLPDDYEEWEIEEKYERVMNDINAEVKYIISELCDASYEEREKMFKQIEQAIAEKYGLEEV